MEKINRRRISGNFILLLITVILVLLIGEVTIRVFYPLVSNYDLEMSRYAAYGKIPIGNPKQSHTHKPGAYFKKLYGVEVKINSKGLRDYEYSYTKPKSCYRILVLGDSITFGWGVPPEDTYPKVLEKKLNKVTGNIQYDVINAGVGNYKLQNEVIFLKQEGLKYNPDMIILGYFINDAEINFGIRYFYLKKYSYLYTFLWSRWNAIRTKINLKRKFVNYYISLYDKDTKTRDNFEKYVAWLRATVIKENLPLMVILIPDVRSIKDYPFRQIHRYVTNLFKGCESVKVIDLLDYFDKDVDPITYWVSPEDPHHNAKAHRIIAEAIYSELLEIIDKNSKYEGR